MKNCIGNILILTILIVSNSWTQAQGDLVQPLEADQKDKVAQKVYKGEAKRTWNLMHTKLELVPYFELKKMYGKAYLTLRPYRLPQDFVTVDAKGMEIRQVFLLSSSGFVEVTYEYDNLQLDIQLNREYRENEQITLVVEYVAVPYELEEKNVLPSSGKGLYFIDGKDKNPKKGMQMWTQGESESTSCWMPTIDAPNERCSQEIAITVPAKLKTLSNGILENTTFGSDGTKTDYWRQKEEHPPYLAALVVGDFEITRDNWGPLYVDYYTTPDYHEWAKDVFGETPYMMSFFSEKFGVDFPWAKYAQVVVSDFNWGAMENTTATIFNDLMYADNIDLIDHNFEDIIAHELVHQWFGDYVTCESWAHLALNESFATYGEYLWRENNYGKMDADRLLDEQLVEYLDETVYKKESIINYHYDDQEDLFDSHRYEKGSRVLHMLRNYLGDEAFFESLRHYIYFNKNHAVEIYDLRKSFEHISGEDLNWFFDQWFMREGHPILNVSTSYKNGMVSIDVDQEQDEDAFVLPLSVDFYFDNGKVEREQILVDAKSNHFEFKSAQKPSLINVDADKILLGEKKENKLIDEYVVQFERAPLFKDKLEVLDQLKSNQGNDVRIREIFVKSLSDKYWGIRRFAVEEIDFKEYEMEEILSGMIKRMALKDSSIDVRTAALATLEFIEHDEVMSVCEEIWEKDSSRMLKSLALDIIESNDHNKALTIAGSLPYNRNADMLTSIANIYSRESDSKYLSFYKDALWGIKSLYANDITEPFTNYLSNTDDQTFADGLVFIKDLVEHEESDEMITSAKNVLLDLSDILAKEKNNKHVKVQEVLRAIGH